MSFYGVNSLKKLLSDVVPIALWSSQDLGPDVWREPSVTEWKLKQQRQPWFQRLLSFILWLKSSSTFKKRKWKLNWPACLCACCSLVSPKHVCFMTTWLPLILQFFIHRFGIVPGLPTSYYAPLLFMLFINGWFVGRSSPGGDRKGRQTDKEGEEDMQRENTWEFSRGGEGVQGGSGEEIRMGSIDVWRKRCSGGLVIWKWGGLKGDFSAIKEKGNGKQLATVCDVEQV